jgi:hypothetical protein
VRRSGAKKSAGNRPWDGPALKINKRALPTLSVIANTIGVKVLTTVFGMGTGVSPSPRHPQFFAGSEIKSGGRRSDLLCTLRDRTLNRAQNAFLFKNHCLAAARHQRAHLLFVLA